MYKYVNNTKNKTIKHFRKNEVMFSVTPPPMFMVGVSTAVSAMSSNQSVNFRRR